MRRARRYCTHPVQPCSYQVETKTRKHFVDWLFSHELVVKLIWDDEIDALHTVEHGRRDGDTVEHGSQYEPKENVAWG